MRKIITSIFVSLSVFLGTGIAHADQYFLGDNYFGNSNSKYQSSRGYNRGYDSQTIVVKRQVRNNNDAAAAIIGFVGGVILGSVINDKSSTYLSPNLNNRTKHFGSRYGSGVSNYSPTYFPPAPSSSPVAVNNTFGEPWSREWKSYCKKKYRSFSSKTGTYLGYDGKYHFCVLNR